ncbi:MAG: prolipoprotein diacylglyceryl transferase, partial [bacterium]|nr:prolipoprotein diacylglyceryl transferase [bacterium]
MQFFILVLMVCLFIFLYCVYVLANDDFIFLRRDVTMEKLFNMIFLGAFISLFGSRLFYGFFHAKGILVNPLVFLLIPYFPGLSLLGGVVGAGVYFLFLAKRKENSLPLGRISDFFSIAFLISLPIGFLGYFMFS